jgi:hypothetical protein
VTRWAARAERDKYLRRSPFCLRTPFGMSAVTPIADKRGSLWNVR